MNKFKFVLWILGLSTIYVTGCGERTMVEPDPIGEAYYPVKLGNYLVYNVRQFSGNNNDGLTDTLLYQLKEIQADTFRDIEGNLTYKLERYIRVDSLKSWSKLDSLWTVTINKFNVQKVESNLRKLKLTFPIVEANVWNGNAYNLDEKQTYKYGMIDKPYVVAGKTYPETAHVIQKKFNSLIETHYANEYYAKDIGLVYKSIETIYFHQENFTDTLDGMLYYQELSAYYIQ